LYISLVSRLVPLLLMSSVVLVATRWTHDRLSRHSRAAGAVIALIIVAAGLVWIVPYAARMGLLVGTRLAIDHSDWPVVADRVDAYAHWGGRLEGNLLFARGLARAHAGNFNDALSDFVIASRSGDPLVQIATSQLNAGLCLYAMHRDRESAKLLLQIPDDFHAAATRDYLLGRIAEHQGAPQAEERFRRSLIADPTFTPALYRLLRIFSMRHDTAAAQHVVADVRRTTGDMPLYHSLIDAIQRGEVLVDYEPFQLEP
jgi:hypothetical protein